MRFLTRFVYPRHISGRSAALFVFGVFPLLAGSIGFLGGWSTVRFLSHDPADQSDQPAPAWLAWVGVACATLAVIIAALAVAIAPLQVDVPNGPVTEPPLLGRWGCSTILISLLCFEAGNVAAIVAAPHSAYRWRPLWLAVGLPLMSPFVFLMAGRQNRAGRADP